MYERERAKNRVATVRLRSRPNGRNKAIRVTPRWGYKTDVADPPTCAGGYRYLAPTGATVIAIYDCGFDST